MGMLGELDLVVLLLTASVCMVAIFRYLRLSPVLGYLVAGLAIGPYGIGFIKYDEIPQHLADFGVIFLLFMIGLEMTLDRLASIRKHVFGFGLLQILFSVTAFTGVGLLLKYDFIESLVIGFGLSMSSSAIVLQVLQESGKQSTQTGRLSLATLIMQDFAVVPLLVVVPLLSGDSHHLIGGIMLSLIKVVAVLFAILVLGRIILRPIFRLIWSTTNEELFVATTLLLALGSALITERLGLSMALGAFAAGLLVAETEYQHQVEAEITPFKGLFLGLFFMTMGMKIDWHYLLEHASVIALWVSIIIVIKAAILYGLCKAFRFPSGVSLHTALLLSQGGEFAFVLLTLAAQDKIGIIDPKIADLLMMIVTTSMALTPLLAMLGAWLAEKIEKGNMVEAEGFNRPIDLSDLRNHVIVVGFGQAGQMVAQVLREEGIAYVVVDNEATLIAEARHAGIPIYHGDATRRGTLEHLQINHAQSVVVTVHNDLAIQNTIVAVRRSSKDLPVIARTKEWFETLGQVGEAVFMIPESFEMGLQLAGSLLKYRGFYAHEIERMKTTFRANHYAKTKDLFIKDTVGE